MSFDLAVWYPEKRINNEAARDLYARLCEGDTSGVLPNPAVDEFYAALTATHPEIDTIPPTKTGDHDYCPWSCKLDRSPGHIIMACVWSKATYVFEVVEKLARDHGLALYDPQSDKIIYPDGSTGSKPASHGAFWILALFGLLFAGIFVWSARLAPSGPTVVLYVMAGLCGLMAVVCIRQALR
jgi:hypothetical protein